MSFGSDPNLLSLSTSETPYEVQDVAFKNPYEGTLKVLGSHLQKVIKILDPNSSITPEQAAYNALDYTGAREAYDRLGRDYAIREYVCMNIEKYPLSKLRKMVQEKFKLGEEEEVIVEITI